MVPSPRAQELAATCLKDPRVVELVLRESREVLRAVPDVAEVSIGHALIADALELGYTETVKGYLACIDAARVRAP